MPTDPSFRMTIDDVFSIKNRGTVVVGKIESGSITVGDELYFKGPSGVRKASVTALEALHKQITHAEAGENIGILFKDLNKADFGKGDILSGNDADYAWS